MNGDIFSLKNGYGFISYPPNNLFFHHSTVTNVDFSELFINDFVAFTLTHNDKGQLVAVDVKLLEEEE
jgi:cold shock CspA family protein